MGIGEKAGGGAEPLFELLQKGDEQQGDEEGPKDVLVEGIDEAAAVHQVKGHLGEHRPGKDTQQVEGKTGGVEVPLHQQEGKDGVSHPPHAGEPVGGGEEGGPHMVAEHEPHGQDVEHRPAEVQEALLFLLHALLALRLGPGPGLLFGLRLFGLFSLLTFFGLWLLLLFFLLDLFLLFLFLFLFFLFFHRKLSPFAV